MAAELITNLDLTALILFLGGWIMLIYRDYTEKTNSADPLAIFFFMAGSIVLAVTQYFKNIPLFVIIGIVIATLSITHWFYIPNRVVRLRKEIMPAKRKISNR